MDKFRPRMRLKCRLAETENIICAIQECKNGKRNVLVDRNVVNTPEILEELKKVRRELKFEEKIGA